MARAVCSLPCAGFVVSVLYVARPVAGARDESGRPLLDHMFVTAHYNNSICVWEVPDAGSNDQIAAVAAPAPAELPQLKPSFDQVGHL